MDLSNGGEPSADYNEGGSPSYFTSRRISKITINKTGDNEEKNKLS